MSLDEINKVCNNADMIVCGYAFTKKEDRKIQILQIHPPYHALILSTEGVVLETALIDKR